MKTESLRARVKSGRLTCGTLIVSPSPRWPATVAGMDLDFVFIDTEHIPLDRAQLSWMCQTYQALGLSPVVRIPSPDPYQACMAFDGGAVGVVAPYVETAAQVQRLCGVARFRPIKGERLDDTLADPISLEPALAAYVERINRDSLLVVNIESTPALARLDELLVVPGVDVALIGPHDLSCSLGIPEAYDHPRFDEAVRLIIDRARAHGVAAGIHWWGDLRVLQSWIDAGMSFVIYSADTIALAAHVSAGVSILRGQPLAAGEAAEATSPI